MRFSLALKILTLATIGLMVLPSLMPVSPITKPVMASYNPAPANNFHSPLSTMALVAITGAQPDVQPSISTGSHGPNQTSLKTIQQNALRFILDNSYFPQVETSIAVDPNNPTHVVGGFNDAKYFFCRLLRSDCGSSIPASISGFTTSTDGGNSVAKSSDIPSIIANGTFLTSWGDPSVVPAVDGNFFYASLAINPITPFFGNGVMIAKSNSNLFDPNVSCITPVANPTSNACWNAVFVFGNPIFPVSNIEDKDRIAVDRDPSSPYYGSLYIGWQHFFLNGISQSYLARCDGNLASCKLVSGGNAPVASGNDLFADWTTPVVDKNGNVYVSWCNFGTIFTFGPVNCRISSSPPGGESFGAASDILSYMGGGTTFPTNTIVIGWATEQFRTAPGIISVAVDQSAKSNNLYFTTTVCIAGHYYVFRSFFEPIDNPGTCGQSAVLFSQSTNNGLTWSSPTTMSNPAVNDQPYVTVDSQTGTIYLLYYTTQYDPFNHRIDVVASISNNGAKTFHQQRITTVSDEPDSDPQMFNYLAGFGGSYTVPQYGDYFEATARGGTLWVLFTGNYAVEAGTFQTDPFLAVLQGG